MTQPRRSEDQAVPQDPTVLLVGSIDDKTVEKATALGLRVLLLQHPSKVTDVQKRLADVVEVCDYTEWALVEPVARRLWESPGFTMALSLTEPGLENAGRVNDLLGLPGPGYEVAHRLRDKLAMREHLARHDAVTVGAALLRRREEMEEFAARYGYPFIVKPRDLTASVGVTRVDGPADADRVWAAVEALRGTRTDRVTTMYLLQDFVMEEYVDGPEFSVESFSFAGRHIVIAITEKFVGAGSFAELGHALPARLDAATEEQVCAAVSRFLTTMGLRDGMAHTEIRLSSRGPVVIEGHNRGAGDAILDLVTAVYGIDLATYALGWPFGLVLELSDPPPARGGACVRSLVGDPGRVASVAGVGAARALPGVLDVRISAKPGDIVRRPRDNWDRLGLVVVTGVDTTAAVRRGAEVIRDAVHIQITDDTGGTHLAYPAEVEPVIPGAAA